MKPALYRRRRRSGGGLVTVTDSFTRADSALTLGTTSTGQAWQYLSTGVWGISGNKAYRPTGSGSNKDAAVIAYGRADCTVQVTFSTHAASQRIGFRYSDLDNGFMVNDETGSYTLYRLQAGSYTSIGSYATTTADGDVLKAVLSGTSITIFLNGVSRIAVTDAFNSTATMHGLASNADATPRWDDFSIVP